MRDIMIILLTLLSICLSPTLALAWVEGADIFGGNPSVRGFVRNYSTELVTGQGLSTSDYPSRPFCYDYQQIPFQKEKWPRLKAPPGAVIKPRYSKRNTTHAKQDDTHEDIVSWYGTREYRSPDSRTFSEIIKFQKGIQGEHLITYSSRGDAERNAPILFRIPYNLDIGSTYTLYWMWNRTDLVDSGWLIYTSCMDIDIVGSVAEDSTRSYWDRIPTSILSSTPCASSSIILSVAPTSAAVQGNAPILTDTKASEVQSSGPVSSAPAPTSFKSSKVPPLSAHDDPAASHTRPLAPGPSGVPSIARLSSKASIQTEETRTSYPLSSSHPLVSSGFSSMLPTSSWGATAPYSSPLNKSSVHTVKVNAGPGKMFNPERLEGIASGDTVEFHVINGVFNLYTTSFEYPCNTQSRVGNSISDVQTYRVMGTKPVWFIACPALTFCYCDQKIHFGLNPGQQKNQFSQKITSSVVILATTTLPPPPPPPLSTVTTVVWVQPNKSR